MESEFKSGAQAADTNDDGSNSQLAQPCQVDVRSDVVSLMNFWHVCTRLFRCYIAYLKSALMWGCKSRSAHPYRVDVRSEQIRLVNPNFWLLIVDFPFSLINLWRILKPVSRHSLSLFLKFQAENGELSPTSKSRCCQSRAACWIVSSYEKGENLTFAMYFLVTGYIYSF